MGFGKESVPFSWHRSTLAHFDRPGEVVFHQGEFIALVGPHGGGKTTLLQLLGSMLHSAREGNAAVKLCLFVPTHLRLLHISMEPLFFTGTLLDNLRFGLEKDHPHASMERIITICHRLGVSESTLSYLESDVAVNWTQVF